jgi:hypothetical protein
MRGDEARGHWRKMSPRLFPARGREKAPRGWGRLPAREKWATVQAVEGFRVAVARHTAATSATTANRTICDQDEEHVTRAIRRCHPLASAFPGPAP